MKKPDRVVHNLSEFTKKLITDLSDCNQPVWFRGQASHEWPLIPSIARSAVASPELNLIKRFKQNATLLLNPLPAKLIDWLFIMQHHGATTRLLDWTESALVASYFAADSLTSDGNNMNGAIWALLPVELNKVANIFPEYAYDIPSFDEDQVAKNYSPEIFTAETTSNLYPIAIMSPRNSPRMQVQLSVFTINHRNNTPIEKIGDKQHIWRYIIPDSCKSIFKNELKCIGFGKFQLFPELQSIGDLLKE